MANTRDTKQSPPERRNWVAAIAPDAGSAANTAFARAGFRDPTLVLRWAEIAGADVARVATPIKFVEGAGGGTLTLKTEPGAALLLQHESRTLCERINGYLGRPAVARLRFVQGTLLQKPPPPPRRGKPPEAPAGDLSRRYEGPDKVRDALIALARARQGNRRSD